MDFLSRFSHLAERASGKLKVGSALDAVLWFALIAIPTGLWKAESEILAVRIVCITIAVLPVLIFAIGFFYFMLKSPEKLRSEQYELRKMALEIVEHKGGQISIAETSVEAISNIDYQKEKKFELEGPSI